MASSQGAGPVSSAEIKSAEHTTAASNPNDAPVDLKALVAVPPELQVKNYLAHQDTLGGYLYDLDMQKYYGAVNGANFLLHHTPQITLDKSQARKLLKQFVRCATELTNHEGTVEFVKCLRSQLNIRPSVHRVLHHDVIVYHAIHDSIFVRRDKSTTSLYEYLGDKMTQTARHQVFLYIQLIRPTFTPAHECTQRYTHGPVSFCASCFRFQVLKTIPGGPGGKPPQQILHSINVGKVVLPKYTSAVLANSTCINQATGQYVVDATCTTMSVLFKMSWNELAELPMPKELLLEWLLRDCLFVNFGEAFQNWLLSFNVVDVKEPTFTAGHAIGLVRLGLAIATLGTIS